MPATTRPGSLAWKPDVQDGSVPNGQPSSSPAGWEPQTRPTGGHMGIAAANDLRDIAARLAPDNKALRHCGDARGRGSVVVRRGARGEYYLSGRQHCRLNCCPVCSIQRARHVRRALRARLDDAAHSHRAVLFISLSIPHGPQDDCSMLVDLLIRSLATMQDRSIYRGLRAACKVMGTVRRLDYTWSYQHGHNPHLHLLLFTGQPEVDAAAVQGHLAQAWAQATAAHGRVADLAYGCRVRQVDPTPEDRATVAAYLTNPSRRKKVDRDGLHLSAHGLLRCVAQTGQLDGPEARAWCEYARALKGQHVFRATPALPQPQDEPQREQGEDILPVPGWHRLTRPQRRQAEALCRAGDLAALHGLAGLPEQDEQPGAFSYEVYGDFAGGAGAERSRGEVCNGGMRR